MAAETLCLSVRRRQVNANKICIHILAMLGWFAARRGTNMRPGANLYESRQDGRTAGMSTFDTSPHVLRPQQERSRAALAKIVQAAEKILRKDGIDGFSMAAVAEAAALPIGNIYRRFKGKDELLQAIKHDVTSRIEVAVAERLSQQEFSDIPSLIRALVGAASNTFAGDETLYRNVFDSRTRNPVLDQIGLIGRRRV